VVKALVLVAFSSSLKFESPRVQTIHWGQPAHEAGILPDPCEGDALHGSEVYPTWVGTRNSPALKGLLVIII